MPKGVGYASITERHKRLSATAAKRRGAKQSPKKNRFTTGLKNAN